MLNAICFLVGLIGAALVAAGFWLFHPGLGLISGGFLCLVWSWLVSRSVAAGAAPLEPGGDQ